MRGLCSEMVDFECDGLVMIRRGASLLRAMAGSGGWGRRMWVGEGKDSAGVKEANAVGNEECRKVRWT